MEVQKEPQHAYLSASSAARWIGCPGSAKISRLFPQSSSKAADEGTLAHDIAASAIDNVVAGRDPLLGLEPKLEAADAFYAANPEIPGSGENMAAILEPYVDFVFAEYQKLKALDDSTVIMTEERVDFSRYVPEGFGTSDVVIVGAGMIEVIDLKYGKGVPVSAIGNPQIRLYALGSIEAYDIIYDFDKVKMVIYQPRLDSVTEEILPVNDLKTWAKEAVIPAAEQALSDSPACNPGEWCTSHFCPAVGVCKARAEYCLAIERHSGKEPALLTDEELGDALARAEELIKWAKQAQGYCLGEISTGHPIPGWKVVEGRSVRKYTDEAKVAAAAVKAGYDEALIYERSLLGITKMEGLMGKKNFKAALGDLVYKPPGNPTLAPESDPRPVYNSADADFKD